MAAQVQARDLDRLVVLKRRVETPDGMGGATVEHVPIAQLWAHIRPMRGGERFQAAQLQAESTYVIAIRNRPDILESDVVDDVLGRFSIDLIKRVPRAPFIELECSLEPIAGSSGEST